jgi:SAM-dependent methyltransferase
MVGNQDTVRFIQQIKESPFISKREFIRQFVSGKDALDLGVVAPSPQQVKDRSEKWLHGFIRRHAKFLLGVDILEEDVLELQNKGYNVICCDVLNLRLNRKFDVVICGDLIEHVMEPGLLLDTIAYHLRDDGVGLVTTPNPFAINRLFNILFDGETPINYEHVFWLCPQTMFQLIGRSMLYIEDFYWLKTDFPMWTKHRFLRIFANFLGPIISQKNKLLHTDFGVVLKRCE